MKQLDTIKTNPQPLHSCGITFDTGKGQFMQHHPLHPSPPTAPRLQAAVCLPQATRTTSRDGYSVTCYHEHVPDFVAPELERLYGSFFSSMAVWQMYGSLEGASTFALYRQQHLEDIWLFQRQGTLVRVLNEQINIRGESLSRFTRMIFASEPAVGVICLHAVEAELAGRGLLHHRSNCTEDSVVTLPDSADAYLHQLGKSTRKNLRRYQRRLADTHPSFDYRIRESTDILEHEVRAIIALNHVRMANKGRVSANDETEVQRMLALLQTHGMVGVATIDGKICAGAIAFRFGDHYFSQVRAHDPAYDDDRLGMIGAFLLVSACIERQATALHFMWGRENHKAMFLGQQRDFDHVLIFRSRLAQWRHVRLLATANLNAAKRLGKHWIFARAVQDDAAGRLLQKSLSRWRRHKLRKFGAPASAADQ